MKKKIFTWGKRDLSPVLIFEEHFPELNPPVA
jgi:hypothetical protein